MKNSPDPGEDIVCSNLHRLNDLVHRSFQPLASSLPPGKIEPLYLRRTKVAAARVQVQPVHPFLGLAEFGSIIA